MKATFSLLVLTIAIVFATGFRENKATKNNQMEKGMIKVSVFYPKGEGKTFDWDYYLTKHAPMVKSLLGDSCQAITIDKGISGATAGAPAPYVAIFHMYFKTLGAFQHSFGPHADSIRNDIPHYTNIQPIVQISEGQQ